MFISKGSKVTPRWYRSTVKAILHPSNLFIYLDDGRIAGKDHEWVQDDLTIPVAMFWCMGIKTNLEKPK